MNIQIKTIPHTSQRYPTVGDWVFDAAGDLTIFISDMGNWKYELLVALHELVEVALCKDRNISQESVDAFDIEFEKNRKEGDFSEPGDSPRAPYRKEHFFATIIEKLMSEKLSVEWDEYNSTVEKL